MFVYLGVLECWSRNEKRNSELLCRSTNAITEYNFNEMCLRKSKNHHITKQTTANDLIPSFKGSNYTPGTARITLNWFPFSYTGQKSYLNLLKWDCVQHRECYRSVTLCSWESSISFSIISQCKNCKPATQDNLNAAVPGPVYRKILRFRKKFQQWQDEEFRELFLICGEEIRQQIPQMERKH